MIKSLLSVIYVLCAMQTVAFKQDTPYRNARVHGAFAKIELKVVNEEGAPIPDANIDVFMGMNFRVKGYSIAGRTDTNGVFVFEGKTCGDEISVNVSKPGFYRTSKSFKFAEMGHEHDVVDGRWQPYGAVEKVVLRDIRAPIEMPKELFWKFKYTKAINTWIGYDIKENDFVVPNGNGRVSDFEVYIDWNGAWLPMYRGMAVKIRFTEPFGGYYAYELSANSEFKGPYVASPDSICTTSAEFSEHVQDNGCRVQRSFDHSKCWVVRSRCKVSPDGKLIAANYSVIYDIVFTCKKDGYAGFCITGAFNPTPNDRNLEWDKKNNLCPDSEKVKMSGNHNPMLLP